MSHVDPTEARYIDLSIRSGLEGYMDSASLIADVASCLGHTDVRDAADEAAAIISGLIHDLDTMPVDPSADEWDAALQEADWHLYQLESRLCDATGGNWVCGPYSDLYVVAPASWWDALEV